MAPGAGERRSAGQRAGRRCRPGARSADQVTSRPSRAARRRRWLATSARPSIRIASPNAPQSSSPAAAPVCGSAPATLAAGPRLRRAPRPSRADRTVGPRAARRRLVVRVATGASGRAFARLVGVFLARVRLGVALGRVAVTDDGDLVPGRVDRCLDTRRRLVARAGAVLAVGGVATGAVGTGLVVSRLRGVVVPMTVTWLSPVSTGAETAGSVWLPDPLPSSPEVSLPAVAPLVSPSVVVFSAVLPSPMTVTWFSPASTGAAAPARSGCPIRCRPRPRSRCRRSAPLVSPSVVVFSAVLPSPITVTWLPVASTGAAAPASVWLPDPVPSVPDVVLPVPLSAPSPAAGPSPAVVSPVLVLPSPMTVTWFPLASTGTTAPRPVWLPATVPSSPVVVSLPEPVPEPPLPAVFSELLPSPMTVTWLPVASTGTRASASVWLPDPVPSVTRRLVSRVAGSGARTGAGAAGVVVAVTDDGHLVAGGVDRCGRAGVGLVARAGAVLARGLVARSRSLRPLRRSESRTRARRRCRPAARRPPGRHR